MTEKTPARGFPPAATPQTTQAPALGSVDHLHFDRRARVWRVHAELVSRGRLIAATAGDRRPE